MPCRHCPSAIATLALLFLGFSCPAWAADLGEGTDLEIGGPGPGRGKFQQVRDLVFDARNRLYVLDGVRREKGAAVGNGLVQQFDDQGNFLREFSVVDPKLGDRNDPTRLAVDGRGHVWVTQPRAGLVQEFGPDGKLLAGHAVPGAYAVTVRPSGDREQVVVVPNEYRDNRAVPVRELVLLDAGGKVGKLALDRPVSDCQVVRSDARGNLYLQAHLNQIYKFDPTGKLLHVLGGGTSLRVVDGSELLATVAVDSRGRVYANTFGNPSNVSRFDADLSSVTQREGQFAWADAWGEQSLFAVDRNDRLWVASLGVTAGDQKYHYRPCVMRLEADFFDPSKPTVTTHGTDLLGLHLAVESKVPDGVTCELAPVSFELVAKASTFIKTRWRKGTSSCP
jgi:hypothetical protein